MLIAKDGPEAENAPKIRSGWQKIADEVVISADGAEPRNVPKEAARVNRPSSPNVKTAKYTAF